LETGNKGEQHHHKVKALKLSIGLTSNFESAPPSLIPHISFQKWATCKLKIDKKSSSQTNSNPNGSFKPNQIGTQMDQQKDPKLDWNYQI